MTDAHVRAERAVAELGDLVADLRSGGPLERGRVLARGARLLGQLTPAQRRTLAVEVAREAAPQLVDRITAEGGSAGDVDLSPAQVKAVFDMVARLDQEGAHALASRLRDPTWQREALGLLATDGLDAVAESAGLTEVGTIIGGDDADPASEGAAQSTAGAGEGRATDAALRDDVPPAAAAAGLATAAWDPDGGANVGGDLDVAAREALRRQAEAEAAPPFADRPAAYAPTMPELAGYQPTGIDPALLRFDRASPDPAATDRAPNGADAPSSVPTSGPQGAVERSWFGGAELGVTASTPVGTSLSDRLLELERPSQRLRLVSQAITEVAAMDVEEQAGVVLALPDGWVRRRALHRLLEAGGVSRRTAPRLLRALGGDHDRAWVAASMIEAGIVTVDDVADLVSTRARDRLYARYGTEEG